MATGIAAALSLEEFTALPREGERHELDRGELITMAPPQALHSKIVSRIVVPLAAPVQQGLGELYVEAGFLLTDDPPVVRQPDIAFLTLDQAARMPDVGYFSGAPAIAIEVVSPSETAGDMEIKIRQYLAAGALAVAVVYPRSRSVLVHTPGADPHRLEADDVLSFPEILGDWSLRLAGIFPSQA